MHDKSHLFVLLSGARVAKDVMDGGYSGVGEVGQIFKDRFIKERLTEYCDYINDFLGWLPRVKLLDYKENRDPTFMLLVMAQELAQPISIDELTTFNITAVPHSLGIPDGVLTKTDQSKLLKHWIADAQDVHLPRVDRTIIFIENGNARLH